MIVIIVFIIILVGLSVYVVSIVDVTIGMDVIFIGEGLNISYFVLVYLVVYFVYFGWDCVIYVVGEVKCLSCNLFFGFIGGVLVAIVLYMLMCYVYM